ncbi:PREDICTED: glycine receptor subunit alpha-1-like [Nicrophorus vespilloides]|uniref:Glycine receptor subunit alpha-1-like n=1 Tax=Nicrophorus vespilloides TaxID=110193 RepID=A0ABM1NDQ7_NICVS|nr:PREDICTED: glycine receptor subunit alpha-1-like [Nicrophorus vespilloides]
MLSLLVSIEILVLCLCFANTLGQITGNDAEDDTTKTTKLLPLANEIKREENLRMTTTTKTTQSVTENHSFAPPAMEDVQACNWSMNPERLTQEQFTTQLTQACRYDKLIKPETNGPVNVTVQLDIRHIEAVDQLQFKMHMLVHYKYVDKRLHYEYISPNRGALIGGDKLREKIWIPHLVLSNERDTSIMGLEEKDMYVSISPDGSVVYTYRMTAMIYCWMDLKKFPFDDQICDVHLKSWTYNSEDLLLHWADQEPVIVAGQLHLTEFKLISNWTYSTLVQASQNRGAFAGEYSNLVFKFQIAREIGYYILDYFLPSIMLVCTSWVTFWLQADNAAPRVTLGTSTMLSFITLASGQSKNLPKVSYIKASEIWFLGCTFFIFASMAEFAFVNIIWRRKKKVELKKVNSKYILKSTLTPKLARRELQRSNSMNNLQKSHSCSSLDGVANKQRVQSEPNYNNYLTVHSFNSFEVPTITMQSEDDLIPPSKGSFTTIDMPSVLEPPSWTTMTPQEIAIWIDKRSRFVFPVAFIIFNVFYWSFVYLL